MKLNPCLELVVFGVVLNLILIVVTVIVWMDFMTDLVSLKFCFLVFVIFHHIYFTWTSMLVAKLML